MIFRKFEIKSAGGCYKFRVTVNFGEISLIDRTPTGFVRTPTVDREIDLRSRPITCVCLTQWVVLKLLVNLIRNQYFQRDVPSRLQIVSDDTQNNLMSSNFHYFCSCLQLIQNQNMKKSFSIKTIIFSCISYVFTESELWCTDFVHNFTRISVWS